MPGFQQQLLAESCVQLNKRQLTLEMIR
eukprot:COSAG05_NODE_3950_length_1754_cov_42.892607_4_plen_27_part_01